MGEKGATLTRGPWRQHWNTGRREKEILKLELLTSTVAFISLRVVLRMILVSTARVV